MRRMFLAGVTDVFPGEVVLGEDGMRFDLPARPVEHGLPRSATSSGG
jgi:hypothetical protein